MFAPQVLKIRSPSSPSMAIRAKSFGLSDSRAVVISASNCSPRAPWWQRCLHGYRKPATAEEQEKWLDYMGPGTGDLHLPGEVNLCLDTPSSGGQRENLPRRASLRRRGIPRPVRAVGVRIDAATRTVRAVCGACGVWSTTVHGCYARGRCQYCRTLL